MSRIEFSSVKLRALETVGLSLGYEGARQKNNPRNVHRGLPLGLHIEPLMHKVKFHKPRQRRTMMLQDDQFQAHTEWAYISDLKPKETDLTNPSGIQ